MSAVTGCLGIVAKTPEPTSHDQATALIETLCDAINAAALPYNATVPAADTTLWRYEPGEGSLKATRSQEEH